MKQIRRRDGRARLQAGRPPRPGLVQLIGKNCPESQSRVEIIFVRWESYEHQAYIRDLTQFLVGYAKRSRFHFGGQAL